MPKYCVEIYNVYKEEFVVDAPDAATATQLAHDYEYANGKGDPDDLVPFAGVVEHVTEHEYAYEEDPQVFAIGADGTYIPVEEAP